MINIQTNNVEYLQNMLWKWKILSILTAKKYSEQNRNKMLSMSQSDNLIFYNFWQLVWLKNLEYWVFQSSLCSFKKKQSNNTVDYAKSRQ